MVVVAAAVAGLLARLLMPRAAAVVAAAHRAQTLRSLHPIYLQRKPIRLALLALLALLLATAAKAVTALSRPAQNKLSATAVAAAVAGKKASQLRSMRAAAVVGQECLGPAAMQHTMLARTQQPVCLALMEDWGEVLEALLPLNPILVAAAVLEIILLLQRRAALLFPEAVAVDAVAEKRKHRLTVLA